MYMYVVKTRFDSIYQLLIKHIVESKYTKQGPWDLISLNHKQEITKYDTFYSTLISL